MRDPVMTIMFILFLAGFVLLGVFPTWQRFSGRLRRMLGETTAEDDEQAGDDFFDQDPAPPIKSETRDKLVPLDGYEWFAFRQIAQSGRAGLSFRQIRDSLHVETVVVRDVLEVLQRQGLVSFVVRMPFRVRYVLTKRGATHPTAGPVQEEAERLS